MDFLKKLLYQVLARISPLYTGQSPNPDIVDAVHNSLREWKLAESQFNYVEPGMIDYMVFRINAAERHYMALLSMARAQGVKAWPDDLAEAVRNPELAGAAPELADGWPEGKSAIGA